MEHLEKTPEVKSKVSDSDQSEQKASDIETKLKVPQNCPEQVEGSVYFNLFSLQGG